MWVTTHELLQFCRDKTHASHDAHENDEDNFVDIPGITDILSKWYGKSEFSVTVWK